MFKLIQYGAGFCSQCKMQLKEFNKLSLECPFEYLDVEDIPIEETRLLNIKTIPTTILYKSFDNKIEEMKRWVGFVKSTDVNNLIKSLHNE